MPELADNVLQSPWVAVIGDVVLGHQPVKPDTDLTKLLESAETSFGNLETPLTARGSPAEKAFVHRCHPDLADDVDRMGLDVVTLANNHILDYGVEGLDDTRAALERTGIGYVGAGNDAGTALRPLRRSTASGTVALLGLCAALPPGFAAAPQRPGAAPLRVLQQVSVDHALMAEQPGMAPFVHTRVDDADLEAACAAVTDARRDSDLVVVAVHWGVPHGFAAESYGVLAEYQRPAGHALVDAGADLVIGHHPHEVHPMEVYRGGLIAYSIGNYLFHNWSRLSADASETGAFPVGIPAAPYQSAFGADVTNDSVLVAVEPASSGRLVVRFVPTTMVDGEPALSSGVRAGAILDRLARNLPPMDGARSPSVARRDDLLPETAVGEVSLDLRA